MEWIHKKNKALEIARKSLTRALQEAQAMPAVVASRPQSSEQMFQALKQHILRERQKKKQEQEADAEVERQRKERELQQKQDVMTIEENREQIAQLEGTLSRLRDDKHQLFLQLKKVLNEDDKRRQQVRQQETSNEVVDMYPSPLGIYPSSLGGHISQLVTMQQSNFISLPNRPMYKVPAFRVPSVKRPRSPSPPSHKPQYSQHYAQKPAPPPPPPPRVVAYRKPNTYSYYHHGPGPPPSQPTYAYPSQQFGPSSSRTEVSHSESETSKHHMYMTQTMSHPIPASWSLDKFNMNDDKYYPIAVASIRPATHVPVHGGAIPIQQPAQGTKTGGITSGYPIRPPSSSLPQPHLVVPSSNTSHGVYQSQPSSSRLVYSQGQAAHYLPRDL